MSTEINELINEMFNERILNVILEKPLFYIQMVPTVDEDLFAIEAIRTDDFYIRLLEFNPRLPGHMQLWTTFKKHYLLLNKSKFGDLCHYEIEGILNNYYD